MIVLSDIVKQLGGMFDGQYQHIKDDNVFNLVFEKPSKLKSDIGDYITGTLYCYGIKSHIKEREYVGGKLRITVVID